MDRCQGCGAGDPEFSLEPDDGAEVLSCAGCLAAIVTRLFDDGSVIAPAWGMKVYDVRPHT